MAILGMLVTVLAIAVGLVSFACFIYNIVVAFQNGDTVSGILSICGIIGFILGWVNVGKWGHQTVMIIWSIAIVASIVLQVISMLLLPMIAN